MAIPKAKIEEWASHTDALTKGDRAVDRAMQHDGECSHGMWWRDCPNEPCDEKEWERGHILAAEAVPALLREREEMLALLREAMNPKPPPSESFFVLVAAACAFCSGTDGQHGPHCRGAAFLREAP